MVLSAVMMLEYLGEIEEARKLEESLITVLTEGKIVTEDLGGTASTMEMAAEIRAKFAME
jgi:3-isopropylmalate dehydrogenase